MPSSSPHPVLAIEELAFAFRDRAVLAGINLSLEAGRILALLGPNGAGMSTLIRCICGRLRPDRGQVRVDGADPLHDARARAAIGLVPQQIALYPHLTVAENLAVFARLAGVQRGDVAGAARRSLEVCDLTEVADRPAGRLSGGWQRRVNIGCAMSHAPELLILDEPTVGIDPPAREEIERLLSRLADAGMAVLMTSHDLAQLESLADEVAFLSEGRVAATGAPDGLIREFFDDRRECRVSMRAPAPETLAVRLRELGLQPVDAEGLTWTGLVAESSAWTLQSAIPADAPVLELRVRRPGLDTLWTRLYGQAPEAAA